MYRAGLYEYSGLQVTNNVLNMVVFGFKNLNIFLTKPNWGCKILIIFLILF
jgi:hypothetical protein